MQSFEGVTANVLLWNVREQTFYISIRLTDIRFKQEQIDLIQCTFWRMKKKTRELMFFFIEFQIKTPLFSTYILSLFSVFLLLKLSIFQFTTFCHINLCVGFLFLSLFSSLFMKINGKNWLISFSKLNLIQWSTMSIVVCFSF